MQKTVFPLLLLLAYCFCPTTSYAQNIKHYHEADSIKNMLSKNQLDSATAYNRIADYLLDAYNFDSAFFYVDEALKIVDRREDLLNRVIALNNLAKISFWRSEYFKSIEIYTNAINLMDTNNYTLELGSAYEGLGVNAHMLSDFEKAAHYYNRASAIFFHTNDTLRAAKVLNNIGVLYYYSGELEKSKESCEQALELFEQFGDKARMILSHMQLGQTYGMWGNHIAALDHLIECKNLIEELGETRRMGGCLMRIGGIYEDWNNDNKAHEYYEGALVYYKQQHDSVGMSTALSSIADFYRKNGEYKKALDLYFGICQINKNRHLDLEVGLSYYFIGEVYNDMEELDTAMKYLIKAVSIIEKYGNQVRLAHIKNLLGRVNLKLANYQLAEELILESLEYAFENNQHSTISSDYYALSILYKETKDYNNAYYYLEKYIHLHDSIFSQQMYEKIAQLQSGFEIQQKDNEIQQLNEAQKIQDLQLKQKNDKLKRQRLAVFGFIFVILLISTLVMVLLRQKQTKNKAFKLLEESNIEINQSRKELMRAKEKAEESDKLKTAFLANISHEIRNPLNVILGMSEVLAKNNFTGNQKEEYLNMININGEILLGIINDVLDMAKIESGVIKTKIDEFNQAEFFNDLKVHIENLKNKINKEHIDIRFELADKQINLKSDKYKLNQIFSNLLMNALKFTESGHVVLGDMQKDGERIFYIKDTGIGISENDAKIIFNRFIQADNFLTKKYQGTGLGLAITRSLVTILDGRIWVESEPGRGSTFYFTIHTEKDKSI